MSTLSEAKGGVEDAYRLCPSALVIGEPGAQPCAATEALDLVGVRTAARVSFAEACAQIAGSVALELVVVEAGAVPETVLEPVLASVDAAARDWGANVVAAIDPEQIDLAAARLLGRHSQILCAPTLAERVAAYAIAKQRTPARMHDASRDDEIERLQRLNEEVARIADTLARLTRGEEAARHNGVRDPGSGYRGPDGDGADTSAGEIRQVIRARRLRAQYFDEELFADPAWDMLLDLFAASLEDRRVSVSSLCIAAAVPPTTALRWIATMHDAGLFERQADPSDRRRAYIALSAKGLDGMRGYAAAAKRQGLGLV